VSAAVVACFLMAGCADRRVPVAPASAAVEVYRPAEPTRRYSGPAPGQVSPGLVPWRDPRGDMARFFPGATGYESETRILSHRRLELAKRLGRAPMGDDLLLRLHPVRQGTRRAGVVLVQRVRGEHGAIEMVLALTPEGRVRGARLQRSREPGPVMAALTGEWLAAFTGKSATDAWRMGSDLPSVPAAARRSAEAVAGGARTALILWQVARQEPSGG